MRVFFNTLPDTRYPEDSRPQKDDILWAMDKNRPADDMRRDVLAVLYSLKGQVVRV